MWLQAGFWGLVAGGALVLGAAVGYRARLSRRVIAGVMAFGAGVLVSALGFELVEEAFDQGGLAPTVVGFAAGAVVYTAANRWLAGRRARHRKSSGDRQPSEAESPGSGGAIAVGALIDGIPESLAIGLTLLDGAGVSLATVAAIFVSNVPEGLSSAAGMRRAGRSPAYVFGLWGGIAVVSGLAAVAGATVFAGLSVEVRAIATASAAGAILAMLMDTMIPEAFEGVHDESGLVATAGFICSFAMSVAGG